MTNDKRFGRPARLKRNLSPLFTKWGENIDENNVLTEYPRPQLVRHQYKILNGFWKYSITKTPVYPKTFDGNILVPFSPESPLSGVSRQVKPDDFLWYETNLSIPSIPQAHHLLLHFGAVDQYAAVFINGIKAGTHRGGYLPFSLNITSYIMKGDNIITVRVQDKSDHSYHTKGKQSLKPGGIFYTAQSGIWQTVWLEWVPQVYIQKLVITPDYDRSQVTVQVIPNQVTDQPLFIKIREKNIQIVQVRSEQLTITIPLQNFKSWSPQNPFLYDLSLSYGKDQVSSYFAMRIFTIERDVKGINRICLNHSPYFMHGVLDQGYWPDGLYTAPSDDAMIFDIVKMKELGFCMIRKHVKIEPSRWYYHCDRLGMIVWQDMVNGGDSYLLPFVTVFPTIFPKISDYINDGCYSLFSRNSKKGRREWILECKKTIEHLSFFPCIAAWVPFNEGWGQFDANSAVRYIKKLDPDRLIDQASGWFDQGGGDFKSVHNYFRTLKIITDKLSSKRAFVLSEYGGYALQIKDHVSLDKVFGYRRFLDEATFSEAYHKLINQQLKPLIEKGLSAAVYTQLSDVEEEVNGLYTYDRKVCKLKGDYQD